MKNELDSCMIDDHHDMLVILESMILESKGLYRILNRIIRLKNELHCCMIDHYDDKFVIL